MESIGSLSVSEAANEQINVTSFQTLAIAADVDDILKDALP